LEGASCGRATKRPSIDTKKADKFIDEGKVYTANPQMRENGQTTKQDEGKPVNSIKNKKVNCKDGKPQKHQPV
jgi:hypothetical protein